MKEEVYRGYSIRFHFRNDRWSAQVRRPGGFMVMKDGFINATPEEGEHVLLERARARVDSEEDRTPLTVEVRTGRNETVKTPK